MIFEIQKMEIKDWIVLDLCSFSVGVDQFFQNTILKHNFLLRHEPFVYKNQEMKSVTLKSRINWTLLFLIPSV